jgi:hypothetical protein
MRDILLSRQVIIGPQLTENLQNTYRILTEYLQNTYRILTEDLQKTYRIQRTA